MEKRGDEKKREGLEGRGCEEYLTQHVRERARRQSQRARPERVRADGKAGPSGHLLGHWRMLLVWHLPP